MHIAVASQRVVGIDMDLLRVGRRVYRIDSLKPIRKNRIRIGVGIVAEFQISSRIGLVQDIDTPSIVVADDVSKCLDGHPIVYEAEVGRRNLYGKAVTSIVRDCISCQENDGIVNT